jgi:hypothetical protein
MSVAEYETLKARIDDVARRLDRARPPGHEVYADEIRRRHAALDARAEEAARTGKSWQAAKVELERDLSGVTEELLRLEEKLDTEIPKRGS